MCGAHADYEGYARTAGDLLISRHGIGGVQFAEVVVDTETGVVKVERVLAVHDCGRPINPQLVESQIYGGVIQGVSYALYEERHLDATSGVQLNANVDQYKIVGSRETPQIEVHLIEQLGGQSSTDARGVGRARQRGDRRGSRECVLQRDRQTHPHFADDARERARGARHVSRNPLEIDVDCRPLSAFGTRLSAGKS